MTNISLENNERTKKYVFFVSVLASFTTPFMVSSVNVAIPHIGRDLNLDASTLNWVVTGFLVASAASLLPLGRTADLYGRKRVFILGMAVYALPSALCAAAPSGLWLILGRVLQGIGGAMVFGTGMAIVTSVFPVGERGKVIGLNVAAVYIGLSTGPVLGGIITDQLGWRFLFIIHLALGVMAFGIALFRLKGEWKDEQASSLDVVSAVLYAVSLIAVMYGFSMLTASRHAVFILAAGLGLLALFVRRQINRTHPLLDLKLFRNAAFAFSNLAALIHYSATYATGFMLSLFLQTVKGLSAQNAGLVLLSQPIMMALVSPMAGRLSDRFQARVIASAGMVLTCSGVVVFCGLSPEFPVFAVVLNLVLIGIGFGLFSSPNMNAIMSSVQKSHYGVANAALSTMRVVGQTVSMAMLNLFFALHLKGQPITSEITLPLIRSFRASFSVFAVLCFLGIWASLARGRETVHQERDAR